MNTDIPTGTETPTPQPQPGAPVVFKVFERFCYHDNADLLFFGGVAFGVLLVILLAHRAGIKLFR